MVDRRPVVVGSVGLPRRLAVVPAPVRDEWLVSWAGRLRGLLGVTWQDAWRVLGLARYKTAGVLPPAGWWLTLSAEKVRSVAAASGLPEGSVEQMLLSRYVGTALTTGVGVRRGVPIPVRPHFQNSPVVHG